MFLCFFLKLEYYFQWLQALFTFSATNNNNTNIYFSLKKKTSYLCMSVCNVICFISWFYLCFFSFSMSMAIFPFFSIVLFKLIWYKVEKKNKQKQYKFGCIDMLMLMLCTKCVYMIIAFVLYNILQRKENTNFDIYFF